MAGGVSSRTRSKKVPLFHSPLFDSSSSKRRKNEEDATSLDSASGSKRRRLKDEAFLIPENAEIISIDDEDEEGFKKEVKIDESGGSSEIGDNKDGNFVDEKIGWDRENPIIFLDESGESDDEEEEEDSVKEGVKSYESGECADKNLIVLDDTDESVNEDDDSDESDDDDEDDDDDESEENETSDEDFNVDELDEVSDDDDDSYDDEGKKKKRTRKDFDVVEELERDVMDKQSGVSVNNDEEKKKKRMRTDFDVVEELVREVNDRQSGICQMKNEKKGSINNDEIEHSDYGSVTNSTTFEKKGSLDPIKGCSSSSSNKKEESMKQKAKSVEKNVSEVSDFDGEKQQYGKRRGNNSEKQKKMENNGLNGRGKSAYFSLKDLSLVKLLAECYSHKENSIKNDPILPEVNSDNDYHDDDDVNPRDTRKPPVCVEAPLIWSLKKVQTVELTEEEEEERRKNEKLEPIWDQMAMYINESEAESKVILLFKNIKI
ncbi:SNF2 family amino-terminal protein [Trifolium pratense]|uniref:SNF2 family amino-terminal protein n=1 Tax=Trifolium pratense TaxID=57577 RepID=A0A2K3M775_TRIPR|nr:SNF2 family amino-terminal protein [Trifolium pratense]